MVLVHSCCWIAKQRIIHATVRLSRLMMKLLWLSTLKIELQSLIQNVLLLEIHVFNCYFFFPFPKPADSKSSKLSSSFFLFVFFLTTVWCDASAVAASSCFCFISAFFATFAASAAASDAFRCSGLPSWRIVLVVVECMKQWVRGCEDIEYEKRRRLIHLVSSFAIIHLKHSKKMCQSRDTNVLFF